MEIERTAALRCVGAGLAVLAVALLSPAAIATPDAGASETSGSQLAASLEQTLVAPDQPRAGDPIELKVTVEHPAGADVRAEPQLDQSAWELLETRSQTTGGEGRSTTTLGLTFQVFRVGSATLEPLDVVVSTGAGGTSKLQTEPESVRIHSVLGDDDEPGLRPAPPPHPVWTRDYTLAWIGGGVAAAFAIGLAALALFRRPDEEEPEATPSIAPEDEALRRLDDLRDSGLLQRGDFMVFYVRLSATIRHYLGRRFGFPGTEMTTAEILGRLEEDVWHGDVDRKEIADWMRRVDRVKFSGRLPSTDEAHEALDRAYAIVRETDPPPTEPPDEEPDVPTESTPDDAPPESASGEEETS